MHNHFELQQAVREKQQRMIAEADEWRRAQHLSGVEATKPRPMRRLGLAWVAVVNLLVGH
jgi:hypothetical protein